MAVSRRQIFVRSCLGLGDRLWSIRPGFYRRLSTNEKNVGMKITQPANGFDPCVPSLCIDVSATTYAQHCKASEGKSTDTNKRGHGFHCQHTDRQL